MSDTYDTDDQSDASSTTEDGESTAQSDSSTGRARGSEAADAAVDALDGVPRTVRVAGIPIRIENFATGEEDPTVGPVSFLSRPREWHAAGVGYITTVVMTLSLALGMEPAAVVSVAAGSGVVLRGAFETFRRSAHVRDALKEPAYAAFGSILGLLPVLGFAVTGKI